MTPKQVDLFVIGGGSGGVRAARVAAQHGARVALAEEYRLGGTCVIRGCVPKKLMVMASRFGQEFSDAAGFGWTLGERHFEWPRLKAQVDAELTRLEGAYAGTLQKAGVELHAERAVLEDAHTVRLTRSGERFHAARVLVATGATPQAPAIPGAELASSSNEFFLWPTQPKRVLVQGAGYIALELANLLQRLGSEVAVVLRGEKILRGFDEEVRDHLQAALVNQGLRFVTGAALTSIARNEPPGPGLRVTLDNGEPIEADAVLRALGRVPNTAGLGLDAAGVALDAHGAVRVDEFSRSSVAHIHAVGDVTNRVMLTPAAIREGQAFADTEFGGRSVPVRHDHIPTAVFTTPELGVIGLTEAQAVQQHAAVDVYSANFRPMKATLGGGSTRTLMKLVVARASDRVLGVHIVGPEAGEMIQLLGVAMQMGARKADLDATLAVHPTAAEELVTMRLPTRRHGG